MTPPSSYPTPPALIAGVPSFTAIASSKSGITINDQPPYPQWSAPLQDLRQDAAEPAHSSNSPTLYYCLYPLCTGEFRDEKSLECHMKVHFEDNSALEQSCGRAVTGTEHDEHAFQFSVCEHNCGDMAWATDTIGQSPSSVTLRSASEWHKDYDFTEDCLSPSCPSERYLSPLSLGECLVSPTYDCSPVSLEVDGGVPAGQQPTHAQGEEYRRSLSHNLTSQSPYSVFDNCTQSPDTSQLHYPSTMATMDVNSLSKEAYLRVKRGCGRWFSSVEDCQRYSLHIYNVWH